MRAPRPAGLPRTTFAPLGVRYVPGMRLTLPQPPSTNRVARHAKGQHYTPADVRNYMRSVSNYLLSIRAVPLRGVPVVVTVDWYRARRSGDLDNRLKVALDSVAGLLFETDAQIVRISAARHEDPARPRLELVVEPLPERAESLRIDSEAGTQTPEAG